MDSIVLRNLSTQARVGLDCWGRDRSQPLLITVIVTTNTAQAGFSDKPDDLTIDYSALGKGILNHVESKEGSFESLYHLALELAEDVIPKFGNGTEFHELKVWVKTPKQLLCADGLEVQLFRPGREEQVHPKDIIAIKDLQANSILGINPHERLSKQRVLVNISIDVNRSFVEWSKFLDAELISRVLDCIEGSERFTLEAFASDIVIEMYERIRSLSISLPIDSIESISVYAEKPSGTLAGQSTGLEITRKGRWLASIFDERHTQKKIVLQQHTSFTNLFD